MEKLGYEKVWIKQEDWINQYVKVTRGVVYTVDSSLLLGVRIELPRCYGINGCL